MWSWNVFLGTLFIFLLPLLDAAPVEDTEDPGEYVKYLTMKNDELQQVAEILEFRLIFLNKLQNIKENELELSLPVDHLRHKRAVPSYVLNIVNGSFVILKPYCLMNAEDKTEGNPSDLISKIVMDMKLAQKQGLPGVPKILCLGNAMRALENAKKTGAITLNTTLVTHMADSNHAQATTQPPTNGTGNAPVQNNDSGKSSSDSKSDSSVSSGFQKMMESAGLGGGVLNGLGGGAGGGNGCCQPEALQIVSMEIDENNMQDLDTKNVPQD